MSTASPMFSTARAASSATPTCSHRFSIRPVVQLRMRVFTAHVVKLAPDEDNSNFGFSARESSTAYLPTLEVAAQSLGAQLLRSR